MKPFLISILAMMMGVSSLRAALKRQRLSAVLVTHLPNVRWLCGFSGSAGSLLVSARDAVFFSDFRYRAQSRREVRGARLFEYTGGSVESVAAAVRHARVSRLGFESDRMTVAAHAECAAAMPGVERGRIDQSLAVSQDLYVCARGAGQITVVNIVTGGRDYYSPISIPSIRTVATCGSQ